MPKRPASGESLAGEGISHYPSDVPTNWPAPFLPATTSERRELQDFQFGLEKAVEVVSAGRMPQLAQRFGFDLADPLARQDRKSTRLNSSH